jgi:formylglycine-generating enzyme required for sulfatase activity
MRTLAIFVALAVAAPAAAQIPSTIGFDAALFTTDQCCGYTYSGKATFRLCDSAQGACGMNSGLVWEEVQTAIVVDGGYMHVELGSVTPFGAAAFSGPRWLEVELDGGIGILAPRLALTSVPFATACADALTLAGKGASAFAAADHAHAWSSLTNLPVAFAPAPHAHAIADVNGLQSMLDGKAAASHTHDALYYSKVDVDGKLALKADAATTYLKSEADLLLAGKADAGTCYPKATVDQMMVEMEAKLVTKLARVCPGDMVPVGDFCIDRYEASIWAAKDGSAVDCAALQTAVKEALAALWSPGQLYTGDNGNCSANPIAMCKYRQYGSPVGCTTELAWAPSSTSGCDDYPASFPDSGNWTAPLYSCSIEGVIPSHAVTWFQAQQACASSSRHLATNGEWQASAAGTPDPGPSTGTGGACLTNGSWMRRTGDGKTCASRWGAQDMIGNVWEWVDMWGQAGPPVANFATGQTMQPWPDGLLASDEDPAVTGAQVRDATYNVNGYAKYSIGVSAVAGLPAAAERGGAWNMGYAAGAFAMGFDDSPARAAVQTGFRCARTP